MPGGQGWLVDGIFDSVLALAMLWLGWQAVHASNLFRAVVSFMMFGLLASLAWVRLEAPDIALAEAALGTGLTGALLLTTLGRLSDETPERLSDATPAASPAPRATWSRGVVGWAAIGFGLTSLFTAALLLLPAPGLGEAVAAALPATGVDAPVTAVLLDFRAWDTLLEIAVMLLAVVAIWALGPEVAVLPRRLPMPTLPALARLLFPLFVLSTFYLLWRGGHDSGGAFPAGAMLAAGAVLVLLAGARLPPLATGAALRAALVLGLLVFLATASGVMVAGNRFFEYPAGLAYSLIIVAEVAAGLSIGVMLTALFIGGEPRAPKPRARE